MSLNQNTEDITSQEYLGKALENAKSWCMNNLQKYLSGFQNRIDYSIFSYVIDNEMIGYDMRLDDMQSGLIRVSARKIKYFQNREERIRRDELYKHKVRGPVEIDPESMFVHEIAEYVMLQKLNLFGHFDDIHSLVRSIENINRKERNLKEWPKD